jgi:hypothetical protein
MTSLQRTGNQVRVDEDALGKVEVPADHLWGAQTQRSHLNFPIGVERYRWGRPVIRALGILKKCAALANGELGQLPMEKVGLIVRAAQEVIDGKLDGSRPYVTDTHATILKQLGLDSRRLEIPGRNRLEIDHGKPIDAILASARALSRRTAAVPRGAAWSAAVGGSPGAHPSGGPGTI